MTIGIAETIPTRIEFYAYTGQPREDWPKWLQVFQGFDQVKIGRIATATYGDDGEPEWWRWFDPEKFYQQFRQIA